MKRQMCASVTEDSGRTCVSVQQLVSRGLCVPERLETLLSQTGQGEEELLLGWELVPGCPRPTWEEESDTFRGSDLPLSPCLKPAEQQPRTLVLLWLQVLRLS